MASSMAGFAVNSPIFAVSSSRAAPSEKRANTSGPKASDNTTPPTADVEEYLPPM